jgi:2'-5' RNA ligase
VDTALDTALLLTGEPLAWFTDRWRSQSVLPVDPPIALSDAIPPHVTLLSPWGLSPASSEPIRQLLQITRNVAPFRLLFDSVGTFPAGTVYLQPRRSPELQALFDTLTRAFPDFPPNGGAFAEWLPHMTVSRRGGETVANEVRAELITVGPLILEVAELSAWEFMSSGRWVKRVSADLAG